MLSLQSVADLWARFFHDPAPATTVAVFRIVLGLILLTNAWGLRRDLSYLYGPHGALGDAFRNGGFGLGRLSLVPLAINREGWLRACWLVHVAAAAALMCGALTRPSAAVAFLTLTTLQSRNPLVTYGGDDVLRIMTFLTVFSQAGASLSVDYWWSHGGWVSQEPSNPWAWRLMQIQVSVVYAKSALAKLRGASWLDGRAVYLATQVEDFRRRRLPGWAGANWRRLSAWGTVGVEAALGSLVWVAELRPAVVAAGVALHVTLEYFLNLYLFGAVMLACLLLFVSPETLNSALAAAGIR